MLRAMARRADNEANVRKLTRVGQASLAVTLPIEIVRKLKLRERQKVVVTEEKGRIIIEDWKK